MRIRTIKPEFWISEDIASLSWEDRLVFVGVWSYVDDNGVGRDNAKLIAAALFPLEEDPRETIARVSRGLEQIAKQGLIVRYIADGKELLYVTNWKRHQRIDRPNKPRYPLPDTSSNGKVAHGTQFDTQSTHSREGVASHSRGSIDRSQEQGARSKESVADQVSHLQVVKGREQQTIGQTDLEQIQRLTAGPEEYAVATARFILDKAPGDVRNPGKYVLAAIKDDPAAYRHHKRAPRKTEQCPEHPGEYAGDGCRACAIDRRLEGE